MKVVIAPDSFKGSASAFIVAEALSAGIRSVQELDVDIIKIPLADGGEGTAEVLFAALKGFEKRKLACLNPNRNKIRATWYYNSNSKSAIMDMASASGITHITKKELNVLGANTYGTGQLIKAAIDEGAKEVMLGLGGSATCDGGIGMANALGFKFLDVTGKEVFSIPLNMQEINSILSPTNQANVKIIGLYDVAIPLLGNDGTVAKYATQKGADSKQKSFLEKGLTHLVKVCDNNTSFFMGDGAAGGLGFGLRYFLNAELVHGFGFISKKLELEQQIKNADYVITGEGKADIQTLDGKLVSGVASLCKKHNKKMIVVAGQVKNLLMLKEQLNALDIFSLIDRTNSSEEAMLQTQLLLNQVGQTLAHKYFSL